MRVMRQRNLTLGRSKGDLQKYLEPQNPDWQWQLTQGGEPLAGLAAGNQGFDQSTTANGGANRMSTWIQNQGHHHSSKLAPFPSSPIIYLPPRQSHDQLPPSFSRLHPLTETTFRRPPDKPQ
ncbi:hypothetical protein ACRALDRAFT_211189 [Sodiomyces alcalophilus JCM 7366]|uniref:uncharacterized protein n=1 Tax=Sodiomyces alcalophilus JCM 7366 TaxID=591952 RepID=UPI0039B3D2C5